MSKRRRCALVVVVLVLAAPGGARADAPPGPTLTREEILAELRKASTGNVSDAVDEDTGKAIPGVSFHSRSGDEQSWGFVHASTVYVDTARTDAAGRLRAVVYPGSARYRIAPRPASENHSES